MKPNRHSVKSLPSTPIGGENPAPVEHLLTHFDRVADAPDAIPRLRRFILDLAVRGKLVPQDPNDEPASELLKRIAAEKARFVREKKISKQLPFLPFDLSEVPFDLPDSWAWCPSTYPSYIVSDKGKKVQTKDVFETGEFPVVDQGKVLIRGYHNDANKVICIKAPIVLFGDHTREMKLIDFDFVVGADGVKLLQPVSLHTPYYFLALQWLPLENRGYGRHFKLLKASFIPLPPLVEQHRIVAKVDELMALCDRLEAARMEREATRDQMATSSLARLNTPDPDPATFQNHTAFALNNLTPLTTRPDQIKVLRQTILNLAVRGKLVPQDPNDEPASELLKRIATEKERLVKAEEIRKGEISTPICEDELPFPLPRNWAWSRLHDIGVLYGGMTPSKNRPDFWDGDIVWLSPKDIKADETFNSELKITALGLSETRLHLFRPDSLFMVARSGILKRTFPVTINRVPASANQDMKVLLPFLDGQERFLQIMFRGLTEFILAELVKTGTTVQSLKYVVFEQQPFPLPPLAEQHRIVAKVDELMTLCDQLEASLSTGNDTRARLRDALLHEALESAGIAGDGSESRPEAL